MDVMFLFVRIIMRTSYFHLVTRFQVFVASSVYISPSLCFCVYVNRILAVIHTIFLINSWFLYTHYFSLFRLAVCTNQSSHVTLAVYFS